MSLAGKDLELPPHQEPQACGHAVWAIVLPLLPRQMPARGGCPAGWKQPGWLRGTLLCRFPQYLQRLPRLRSAILCLQGRLGQHGQPWPFSTLCTILSVQRTVPSALPTLGLWVREG